jgi:hypothetical protein
LKRRDPARNVRTLRRWVDGHARAEGIAVARLQRWVSYMVLLGALDRIRDAARATKDLDATFRDAAELMLDRLDEALREPYGGFTLARREPEDVGPTLAKRIDVRRAYLGRSWSTVKLELSPAEGDTAHQVEHVPAIDVTPFGLEAPDTVPCPLCATRSPRSSMLAPPRAAMAGTTIASAI